MEYFNQINPTLIILSIFGFIILIAFLLLIITGDALAVKQKILGGLSVFCVALISQNSYIIFTSLFIGGLIIASEQFMKDLAGILRADSKDIKDILNYTNASPEEIKEKNKEENKELEIIQRDRNSKNFDEIKKRFEKAREIEKKALNIIPNNLHDGWRIVTNVKLLTDNGASIVVDGLLKNDLTTYMGTFVLEIKYVGDSLRNRFSLKRIIESFTGKILSKVKNVNVAIVIIGDDLTEQEVNLSKEELKREYPSVNLEIFSWNTQKEVVEKVDKRQMSL